LSWPWQIKRIVLEHPRPLSESDLNAALAVAHENPVWRAVHQLIDTAIDNALENAIGAQGDNAQLNGYVGGTAHLRMLREELYNRRALGIEQLGVRVPEVR